MRGSGDYEFSLDNITYTGFGKTHTFSDLQPGIYTVYIRDVNGCSYAIQEEVLIVKFPNIFLLTAMELTTIGSFMVQ